MKKLTLVITIFLTVLLLRVFAISEQVNTEIYETNKIFKLYYNQKFEECMKYCYDLILKNADNSTAYIFYFSSAYQIDKLQETINQIEDRYIKYVQNYSTKGEILEAQREYQILTILMGYSNMFLYFSTDEGNSYLDESINNFRKSLFFPISFSSIYTGLAIAYFEKKLNERTISMITKAMNIKNYDPITLEYYAKIQNKLGNYQQTISKLKNYTHIEYPDLLYQLGFAYEKSNEIDKAIEAYSLASKYDPFLIGQGFISLVRIGDIYLYIKNDKEKAIWYYQEILKILPDSIVAKTKIEEAQKYNPQKKEQNKKK
ncbi:MAG: hypothetical protein RMJ51_02340 [Candidatus Calescibacterium sp.]|nr:hypothetical protein [Candidatus Calescibacterium sp.]MCX7972331.1 hypothetical protein [bacterium]MDW8195065.1 hypothetical protein [Candidatus Calescibacterium sp.]